MWHCAHAIFYCKLKDFVQVQENIYFIDTENPETLFDEAEMIIKEIEGINENEYLELDGHLVYQYAGIRKIIEVESPLASDNRKELRFLNGTKLTYSIFEVNSMEEVQLLVDNEVVDIVLCK